MAGIRRIAINAGGGFVPGLDLTVAAFARAADAAGCEAVLIRDGYDALLDPDRFGGKGIVTLVAGALPPPPPGTGARLDPFHVRNVDDLGMVSEVDRSADLLQALDAAGIDAVVSITGGSAVTGLHAASVTWKLVQRGLCAVTIPKSVENDIAGVPLPLGADSALNEAVRLMAGIATGAREAGRVAVVELPGRQAGWLALQAGLALQADAILLPEIAADPEVIAAQLPGHAALVVVAEGARLPARAAPADPMRASLSPLSDPDLGSGAQVLNGTGRAASRVAQAIQRQTGREVLPLALGALIRGGSAGAIDRLLAAAYGAAAVRALLAGESGQMLSFVPPAMSAIALPVALAGPRVVPLDGALIRTARDLGILLGD